MDLFGLGGGLLEYRASLLAGKGFAVMALAYYNYDDLPRSIETLHLEYFEEAVNYLLHHPEVRSLSFMGCSPPHACSGFTEVSPFLRAPSNPAPTASHSHFSGYFCTSSTLSYFLLVKRLLVGILEFCIPICYSIS